MVFYNLPIRQLIIQRLYHNGFGLLLLIIYTNVSESKLDFNRLMSRIGQISIQTSLFALFEYLLANFLIYLLHFNRRIILLIHYIALYLHHWTVNLWCIYDLAMISKTRRSPCIRYLILIVLNGYSRIKPRIYYCLLYLY